MKKLSITVASILVTALSGHASTKTTSKESPNVIVILADDLGYSDLGCYGATKISTPNIDTLASRGVRFTNAYAPASTSSPSRYALLTGEYAWRKNVGILPADAPLSIDTTAMTMPRMFNDNGYSTALIGKWHLGLGTPENPVDFNRPIKGSPVDIGFDYAYYFPATNDRVPCIYLENDRTVGIDSADPIDVSYHHKVGNEPTGRENPEMLAIKPLWGHDATIVNGISRIGWMSGGHDARWDDADMAQHLLGKARDYIRAHKDEPFFMYYASNNAHEPRVPSKRFQGKSAAGIYGDVIEEFDYCVGGIVEELKDAGIYDNTIIIVTSDNAPMIKEGYDDGAYENIAGHDPYGNMHGEKYSLYEGGSRVPFIISWPSAITTPFEQTQRFGYLDLKSTFASMLGIELDTTGMADGADASELFFSATAPVYREYILTQNNGGDIAIRQGDWKLIPSLSEIYNLADDPQELHNLSLACKEKAAALKEIVKRDSLGVVRKRNKK